MTSHTSIVRPRQLSVVFVALLGLVGGCAQPAPGGREPGPGPGPGTYKPDDVVLRVDIVDGFIPQEYLVTRLPKVSVYGDGRVITEGPVIDIYPSPALPNVLVQTISPAGVNALVTRALDHGVGSGVDFGQPTIMDAPSTRFAVLTDEGPLVSSVNALTEGDGGLTAAQRSARSALQDLLDDLSDLSKTLGPDAVGEQKPYQPRVLAAVSREWTAPEPLPPNPNGHGPVQPCLADRSARYPDSAA